MSNRRYIQHLRSKDVETIQQYGLNKDIPKVPETDNLKDGEIAINYAKDNEIISIKNDNNEIVKFLNEKVIYENEEITAAAMSQLKNEIANEINNINETIENFEPGDAGVQSDWNETDEESLAYIKNKPTNLSDFTNDSGFITTQVQSDWNETDEDSRAYIQHKPTIPTKTSELNNDSGFVTAGEIEGSVQSDWNESNEESMAFIKNKPTIPTKVSDLTNDGINNAPLVIQKNGTDVVTFTANAADRVVANIEVPTKTSDLTNDSGFVTAGEIEGGVQSDWNETSSASLAFIKNKPTIPAKTSDLNNDSGFITTQVQSDWDETDEESSAYIKNNPIFILHMEIEPSELNKTVSIRETYEELAMAIKNGKTILLWGVAMQGDYIYTIDSDNGSRVGSADVDPRNGNYIFYFARLTDSGNIVIYGFGQGRNNSLSLKVFNTLDEVLCVTITSRQSGQSNDELTNISCNKPCSLIYQSYENGVNIIAKNIINDAYGLNGVDSARVYKLVKATPFTAADGNTLANDGTLQFVSYEVGDTFITIYTYNATFGSGSDNWTYSSEKLYYNMSSNVAGGEVIESVTGSGQYDSIQLIDTNGNNIGQPIDCSQFLTGGLLKSISVEKYASSDSSGVITARDYSTMTANEREQYAPYEYTDGQNTISWQEFINLPQSEQSSYTESSYNVKDKYMVIEFENDSHEIKRTMITLSDIFNSANYYTKGEVDNEIQSIKDNFDGYKVVECSPIAITFADDFLSRCCYDYSTETTLPQETTSTYDVLVSITKENTIVEPEEPNP